MQMRRRQIVLANQQKEAEAMREIQEARQRDPRQCPKCGRIFNRGRVLHVKYCRGK